MRVLTVFAHHGSGSFCHAILERFGAGLRQAMHVPIDEFALRYPGIKRVEREFFYTVHDGDTTKLSRYLDGAYAQGREF